MNFTMYSEILPSHASNLLARKNTSDNCFLKRILKADLKIIHTYLGKKTNWFPNLQEGMKSFGKRVTPFNK